MDTPCTFHPIPEGALVVQAFGATAQAGVPEAGATAPPSGNTGESFGNAQIPPRGSGFYLYQMGARTPASHEWIYLREARTRTPRIDRHPFKRQVRLTGEKARTRYVEDWEVIECLSLTSRRIAGSVKAVQAYIRVKLLTGMRRGDLLRLTMSDLKEDGIHFTPNKTKNSTGKRLVIEWSEELRAVVDAAKIVRPVQISPYLFCNRKGECYFDETAGRAGGWDSMWRGFMKRVLSETKVEAHFTEHDLRAKCASDAATVEHARALLSHVDSRLTERVYRRKPEVVKPLR